MNEDKNVRQDIKDESFDSDVIFISGEKVLLERECYNTLCDQMERADKIITDLRMAFLRMETERASFTRVVNSLQEFITEEEKILGSY